MPFIDVKASCEITSEQELRLKEALGEAIARIPGKSESRLMLCFQDNMRMWYAGKDDGPTGAKNVYLRMSQGTDWAF